MSTDTQSFKKGNRVLYVQTTRNQREFGYDAEFIQVSRNREGFAVVIVHAAGQKYRAIVPLRDLRHKPPAT